MLPKTTLDFASRSTLKRHAAASDRFHNLALTHHRSASTAFPIVQGFVISFSITAALATTSPLLEYERDRARQSTATLTRRIRIAGIVADLFAAIS